MIECPEGRVPGWLDPETGEPTGCVENDPFAGFGPPTDEGAPASDSETPAPSHPAEVPQFVPEAESITAQPDPIPPPEVTSGILTPDPGVSVLVAALAFASLLNRLLRRLWGLR